MKTRGLGRIWLSVLCVMFAILSSRAASASAFSGGPIPQAGPAPGEAFTNLANGLFVASVTDLYLPGPLPIAVVRTYRSRDVDSNLDWIFGAFGKGTQINYDLFLYSESQAAGNGYKNVDLIMPDGGRLFCARSNSCSKSDCSDYTDAQFTCASNPDLPFYGSVISYNSSAAGWDLTRKDGTVFFFPQGSPLGLIQDRNSNQIAISRNGNGDITEVSDSNGRYVVFAHTNRSYPDQITQAADSAGRTVNYTYDSGGRLTSVQDANGNTSSFAYSSTSGFVGDMVSATDADGNPGTIGYDSSGRLSSLSGNLGYSFSYTMSNGDISSVTITDPRGFVRSVSFNGDDYVVTDVRAQGAAYQQTTTYARQAGNDLITAVTDQLGRVTSYGYDGLADITSVTRLTGTPQQVTTSYSYGPFARVSGVTDPLGHTTSAGFDSVGDVISLTDAVGDTTTATYNAQGQPLKVTLPDRQNTYSYSYNPQNDLAGIIDPMLNSFAFTWDAAGRMVQYTDALGHPSSAKYDALGHMTQMTDANGAVTNFAYGGDGELTSVTDANSHTSTFTYTSAFSQMTKCDAANRCQTFYYDGMGNVTSVVDGRGVTRGYSYDGLNRLTQIAYNTSNTPGFNTSQANYSYDAGNRLITASDSGGAGETLTRTYDGLDDLLSETSSYTSISPTVAYTYDNAQRRIGMTVSVWGGGVSYAYDNASRLTSTTAGSLTFSIGLDADGRRTSLTYPYGVNANYQYNGDSQVTNIAYSNGLGNLSYGYDPNGRMTSMTGSPWWASVNLPLSATATYDVVNELLTWNGTYSNVDGNGNMTVDPSTGNTYTWNERNQLASVSGGTAMSFQYDALGRRIGRTVSGTLKQYQYDGWNAIEEPSLNACTQDVEMHGAPGLDDWFQRGELCGPELILRDGRNSVIGLAMTNGNLGLGYTYEPFGNATAFGALQNTNDRKFIGNVLDPSGLYYLRNRYYNPTLARFMSPDPIGYAGGQINLYAYVNNDPMNWVDPTGLGGGAGGGWGNPGCDGGCVTPVSPVFEGGGGVGGGGPSLDCTGVGRGLSGRTNLVGLQGGIPGQIVQSGTAAVIPQQFGAPSGAALGLYAPEIHGTIGQASFSAVTDVIGGKSPIPGTNVRTALQQLFPGQLVLEVPGASDQGANAPVTIFVPQGLGGCPAGTSPAGGK